MTTAEKGMYPRYCVHERVRVNDEQALFVAITAFSNRTIIRICTHNASGALVDLSFVPPRAVLGGGTDRVALTAFASTLQMAIVDGGALGGGGVLLETNLSDAFLISIGGDFVRSSILPLLTDAVYNR